MSQYSYSKHPLDSDGIRLLGLMPSKDLTSPINCRLHDYSLRESDKGTHLYEALSYVWGSSNKPKVVFINEDSLPVTANLYTALLHLRDRTFERIIWVDSICINQEDNTEKGHQIQLMAKIFGQANRVIVYLGDAEDDSNQALESIRVAAEGKSLEQGINEMNQRGIFGLLKRPWFQRIWAITGFDAGSSRGWLRSTSPDNVWLCNNRRVYLQPAFPQPSFRLAGSDPSIRGAIFRPKNAIRSSGALSLGELIDMYHTRMATKLHDKVYALLSMSCDTPNLAGLSPDYKVTWKTLLERLVKFILFKDVSVKTWDGKETALIESRGYVLGHVLSIDIDSTRYERQCVSIEFNNRPESVYHYKEYSTRWFLPALAKSIQRDDLVCILQGASKPSIIRAYKDHFSIIVIAVNLEGHTQRDRGYIECPAPSHSMKNFSRDFLLIWNWEQSLKYPQGQAEYEGTIESYFSVPEYLETDTNRAVNSINVALALGDTKNYVKAENILRRQIENYEGILGRESLHVLALKESLAWIYHEKDERTIAENLFLKVIHIRKCFQGMYHHDTLSTVAKLGLVYMKANPAWGVASRDMRRISNRIENNIQMSEEDLITVGRLYDYKMMELLLELERDNVKVTEEVVKAAVGNRYDGYEVMKLLFEKRGEEITITEKVVTAAAGNLNNGYKIMELLFEKRGEEITITEKVVTAAAGNLNSGYNIMELLFEKRSKDMIIVEEVVIAAAGNPDSGFETIKLLFAKQGEKITITEKTIRAAAANTNSGKLIMMLLLEKQSEKAIITEKVVEAAAGNLRFGKEIIMLLLEKRGDDAIIPKEVVVIIAEKFDSKVMALLLEKQRERIVITEEIMKAAVGNSRYGRGIIKLLIEKRGGEVIITVEVLKAARKNMSLEREKIVSLLENRLILSVPREAKSGSEAESSEANSVQDGSREKHTELSSFWMI
ncbi:hypothetical protein BTUL_0069g00110 [Botrytis tulipae]|uniref:Heterokaryon incompatibility domain-containing protein n=1 Tax=Botrytis tulipae TaxID=87230 RepID=A0A4Z1ELW5_9HELO|nr:hypothetical protein BTUL_0069g00110 [Botrytis tulipae]